jgi:hypothetical protein
VGVLVVCREKCLQGLPYVARVCCLQNHVRRVPVPARCIFVSNEEQARFR